MNQRQLAREIARRTNLTAGKVAGGLKALPGLVIASMRQNDDVRIVNFGTFEIVQYPSRTVRNPLEPGKKILMLAHGVPKFHPSGNFKQRLRSKVASLPVPAIMRREPLAPAAPPKPAAVMSEIVPVKSVPPKNEPVRGPIIAKPEVKPPEPAPAKTASSPQPSRFIPELAAEATVPQKAEEKPAINLAKLLKEEEKEESAAAAKPPTEIKPLVAPKPKASTAEETADLPPPAAGQSALLKRSTIEPISIPYIDLSKLKIDKSILALIPEHIARLYQAVPVERREPNTLVVAMIDPGDQVALEFLKKRTGMTVEPRLATHDDITHVLDQYTGLQAELEQIVKATTEGAEEAAKLEEEEAPAVEDLGAAAPASKIVTSLIKRAVRDRASDIHIEPGERDVVARFRVDGVLRKVVSLPKDVQAAVISRIKILTNMKIDETRLPQDGRFQMNIDQGEVDFRVSTFPTVNGEKVVMRILDKSRGILTLDQLGLRGRGFDVVSENIKKSHGMILVTGPTGSGKSTTLYAILDQLKNVTVNIITMEDPVEYRMTGINQGQVNAEIGFNFATGLRSILRQDPNVVMIGEVRDGETATMAVQAALTGHIVLSTLHTNDAAGAIPRLIDMGVEPFLITSSTNAAVAQRLCRKICPDCKAKVDIPESALSDVRKEIDKLPKEEAAKVKGKDLTFYKGKGCANCGDSGYRGRIGIFEILPVTDQIKSLTLEKAGSSPLSEAAIKEGMLTLKQDGILKALEGITTLEEVFRATKD